MKQKDWALIILIAGIAAVASFFLSNMLFGGAKHQQKAEVVDVVTTDFATPDTKYFNSNSINPTQLIEIGNNNNANPFNGKSN